MSELGSVALLPWQVTFDDFLRSAGAVTEGGACCVFVIDDAIPKAARGGYAALVIAYARADEPVCILEDGGAALLIKEGGVASGQVVARRLLAQMQRLSLEATLRAGVATLAGGGAEAMRRARDAANRAAPGGIQLAG